VLHCGIHEARIDTVFYSSVSHGLKLDAQANSRRSETSTIYG
jgi:hypothetical protein